MSESDLKQDDTKTGGRCKRRDSFGWLIWDAGGGGEEELRWAFLLSHRDDLWKEEGISLWEELSSSPQTRVFLTSNSEERQ